MMKTKEPLQHLNVKNHFLIFISLILMYGCAFAQENSADIRWLIDSLELEEGSIVADIGAGDGDQAKAIARHIGPEGQIYSTELGEEALEELREGVDEFQLNNITVIEGAPDRTNLPEECCDAIYMRRVYHHIGNPSEFNESLLRSLKPGGRLGIIDFAPRGDEAEPGERASGDQHGVTSETVVEELQNAGFELLIPAEQRGRYYYLVMKKTE